MQLASKPAMTVQARNMGFRIKCLKQKFFRSILPGGLSHMNELRSASKVVMLSTNQIFSLDHVVASCKERKTVFWVTSPRHGG